jgi:hypothetical protein
LAVQPDPNHSLPLLSISKTGRLWCSGLVLLFWFGENRLFKGKFKLEKSIMDHLWFEKKWSSGALVIFLVWFGLVSSGLALVWSCGKTNQSLPVFLMWL